MNNLKESQQNIDTILDGYYDLKYGDEKIDNAINTDLLLMQVQIMEKIEQKEQSYKYRSLHQDLREKVNLILGIIGALSVFAIVGCACIFFFRFQGYNFKFNIPIHTILPDLPSFSNPFLIFSVIMTLVVMFFYVLGEKIHTLHARRLVKGLK